MQYALGALALALVAFVLWRFTSVGRGARQRDRRLMVDLEPVAERLDAGEDVTPSEIAALCERPELRVFVYHLLLGLDRSELFPEDALEWKRQAEGCLAYWMMHPNELHDPPRTMEHVEQLERRFGDEAGTFFVLRFQMPAEHWAADDGWMLGLSGPFFDDADPYDGQATAFVRAGDREGETTPDELIDWFTDLIRGRVVAARAAMKS